MVEDAKVQEFGIGFVDERHGWVGAMPHGSRRSTAARPGSRSPTMPKATNKIRVVRDAAGADVWAIGLDVRHLRMEPAAAPATFGVR